jgi:hypothetical protein
MCFSFPFMQVLQYWKLEEEKSLEGWGMHSRVFFNSNFWYKILKILEFFFPKKLENLFEITFLQNFVPKKKIRLEEKKPHWCIVVVIALFSESHVKHEALTWVYFQWRRTAAIFVKANFCCHVRSDFNNGGTRQGGLEYWKEPKA